ncbi:MAG: hypothetical protein RR241_00430 [Raoultibacter sp.]
MKIIKTQYPVAGTSALQVEHPINHRGEHIIAFPGQRVSSPFSLQESKPSFHTNVLSALKQSEAFTELRFGSMRGVPFNKMKTGQSIMTGCACAVLSLIVIFFGA